MPTGYIYSPIDGQAISGDCYCNRYDSCGYQCNQTEPCVPTGCYCNHSGCTGCDHKIVGGIYNCCPLDVSGSVGQVLYFRCNSVVGSIKIQYCGNSQTQCVCASEQGDINLGVVVNLYRQANAGCYMGSIIYGHVRNRQNYNSDGQVINTNFTNFTRAIGEIPAVPNGSQCYQSVHSHMDVNGLSRNGLQCNAQVYTSTWIYTWFWNDGWC